jgi:D-3-phosphoglycerate dehydrogenase / 2-oxoglutarate reductase
MRENYYGAVALGQLRALGRVVLHEGDAPLDAANLVAAARDAQVIVADRMTAGPEGVFRGLPNLVAFVRGAVDIRNVDVAAASTAGILVTQAGPGFVASVAELIVGMMVDLARGVSAAAHAYHEGRMPAIHMGRQLSGSTLGIIGYGSIGRTLAAIGQALGMTVLVTDPYATVTAPGLGQADMATLLERSDFTVCLATATPETENLMDAAAFARMRPGACFINVSRGNLVDEAALSAALRSGHLGGAAIDVGRAADQMPSPSLAALPNVIATPHIGGLTPPAIAAQALETVTQVAAILKGDVPHGAVNAAFWKNRP